MARPISKVPLPPHPAIDDNYKLRRIYNHSCLAAKVTCPICRKTRWYPLGTLRQQLKRTNYTGQCRPCSVIETRAGHFRWARKKRLGRWTTSTGYITIGPTFVADSELPMYRAMQAPSSPSVLEHRWVMAKALGRPLLSRESVDHMDGNKQNNDISNLRIYLRGKNQPGSLNGYGTYYHEWQIALARIRELESKS